MRNSRNTRKLTQLKHNMIMNNDDRKKANIVYKITFSDGAVYVGSTKNDLTYRISQHYDIGREMRNSSDLAYRINKLIANNESADVEILEEVSGKDSLLETKRYYILKEKSAQGNILNIKNTK